MTRRLIAQLHLWAGLVLCVPFVLLGLTGSILVFEDELRSAFAGHPAAGGAARPASEIIAAARAVAPSGFFPLGYVAPLQAGELATVRLAPARRDAPGADAVRVIVDPVSLEAAVESPSSFLRQVFILHSTLLLKNRSGRQLVGWLGVATLVMGVSGFVNWWPRRNQWRRAFAVSRHTRGLRLYRELHGAAGIWGLAVFVTVSCAGVYLAFPETVRSAIDLVSPARDLRARVRAVTVEPVAGAEQLAIDGALDLARAAVPGAEPVFAFLPTRPDQPFRIGLLRAGEEKGAPAITVFVDPWARRVIETLDPRQFTTGEKLLAWQHALHAGQALGRLWKLLVFLCGLLPLIFVISGVAMWLKSGRRIAAREDSDLVFNRSDAARRAGE